MKLNVCTHNGGFHADDAFAVAALSVIGEVAVKRSRRPEDWAAADIVLDVGGEYAPEKGLFDHHQRGGAGRRESGVPYAAAGLVWRHYGAQVAEKAQPGLDPEELARLVDERLISAIDAVDTGFQAPQPGTFSVSQVIGGMNPSFGATSAEQDQGFERAVDLAKGVLLDTLRSAGDELRAEKAVEEAKVVGSTMILPHFVPAAVWSKRIRNHLPQVRRVVWEDVEDYKVQAYSSEGFSNENYLPEEWKGLSGGALDAVTGIQGGVFVHPAGFIGGHKTLEGALAMAAEF